MIHNNRFNNYNNRRVNHHNNNEHNSFDLKVNDIISSYKNNKYNDFINFADGFAFITKKKIKPPQIKLDNFMMK